MAKDQSANKPAPSDEDSGLSAPVNYRRVRPKPFNVQEIRRQMELHPERLVPAYLELTEQEWAEWFALPESPSYESGGMIASHVMPPNQIEAGADATLEPITVGGVPGSAGQSAGHPSPDVVAAPAVSVRPDEVGTLAKSELETSTQRSPALAESKNARDVFASRENREAAIKKAALQHPTRKALSQSIGVNYNDMRAWVRDRGKKFTKGNVVSSKVTRIEEKLLPFAPDAGAPEGTVTGTKQKPAKTPPNSVGANHPHHPR